MHLEIIWSDTKNPVRSSVTLEFNPGNHRITRTFNSTPTFPNDIQDDIKLAEMGQFILRRFKS